LFVSANLLLLNRDICKQKMIFEYKYGAKNHYHGKGTAQLIKGQQNSRMQKVSD